ncbi:hypothetical protein EZS27_011010 [termite gut metagenome]|uniref:Uncharacterized protein n=1 Tax=termite gut metagenome TaxID=433724 RepID=A0A5J4S797_9ZZZZ
MEAEIKHTLKTLYIQFLFFVFIPIILAIAYETDILSVGLYADDVRMRYIMETIGILVVIACVPAALMLFRFVQKREIENVALPVALKRYVYLCAVRLSLLEIAVVLNVIVSYITLNNLGGFCVLMALTASAFCLPSKKRLYAELKIQQPDAE